MWSFRLPTQDHDLWIIRLAYARQFPWSMVDLGRSLGISRSQAARTVGRLVEEGLLVERQETYDFNDAHPLAAELGRWIYLTTGAERPDLSQFSPLKRSAAERLSTSTVLPDHWRALDLPTGANEAPTHNALEARKAAMAISGVCRSLSHLEDLAHEVYSDVKAERARDFIHLLGGLSVEANLAAWLLREHAARQDVSRQQTPWEPVVYEVEWARVGFLLDAQAALYESATDRVNRAYGLGRKVHHKRERVVEEITTYPHLESDTQSRVLDDVALEIQQLAALRQNALKEGLYWHGGMPGLEEIGTLGDLLIKHALRRACDDLRTVQRRYAFPAEGGVGAS